MTICVLAMYGRRCFASPKAPVAAAHGAREIMGAVVSLEPMPMAKGATRRLGASGCHGILSPMLSR